MSSIERKPAIRKRFWIPFVLLLASYVLQPVWRMHELRSAAADADQVRILVLAPDRDGRLTPEVVTIDGRPKVDELFAQISLWPSVLECRCGSDTRIELAASGSPLVSLEYMGHALRWDSGRWWTRAELTGAAQNKIGRWLETNGGAEYAAAKAKAKRRWAEYRARQEAEYPAQPKTTQSTTATSSAPQ